MTTLLPTVPLIKRHSFTTDEYEAMIHAGVLTKDHRVELINGEIVEMSPIGPLHASIVSRLIRLFTQRVGDRAIVNVQNPIRADEQSEPQPDVVLVKYRDDFYRDAHPTPADTLLVIEVADSTLDADRRIKIPLYAQSGVPEVWIVNVLDECIEIYRQPARGDYQEKRTLRGDAVVAPANLPEAQIKAADLFA